MKVSKKSAFAIVAISFCLLYIVFAIKPIDKEYQLNPEWKIDVANPQITTNPISEKKLYFKLGQSMGYFTPDGEVTRFISFPYKASINESGYVSYSENNSNATVFSPDGKELCTLKQSGFPYLSKNKIFIFQPGGTSFLMCDNEGNTKWNYSGISPISAFNTSENAVAAGFADGTICEFDLDGKLINKFAPTGSNYQGIYGIAVSNDGKLIAAISGMDRQRFLVFSIEGRNSKIIYHSYIDDEIPLQEVVYFSNDNKNVLYNHGRHISIFDIPSKKEVDIYINGHVLKIIENEKNFFVLSKNKDIFSVHIIEKFATLTGSFSFKAKHAFIETLDDNLYVGRDTQISCIKITKD